EIPNHFVPANQLVLTGRQTGDEQLRHVSRWIVALKAKPHLRQILFNNDRLSSREPIVRQQQVKFILLAILFAIAQQRVKTPPHAVFRNYLKSRGSLAPVAAKTESPEDRIVRQDRRCSAQCAAVTEIYFAGVVPGTAVMRLIQP